MVPVTSRADSLIEYPCDFPIKVMGRRVDDFAQTVVSIVQKHAPDFDPSSLQMRPSRQGNYLGLTVTLHATSRAQLDALYTELSGHPLVAVVL